MHNISTNTNRLKDSTHVSKQKYIEENSMLGDDGGTNTGSDGTSTTGGGGGTQLKNATNKNKKSNFIATKTKEMLPVEQWASGKIEGMYSSMSVVSVLLELIYVCVYACTIQLLHSHLLYINNTLYALRTLYAHL